MSDILNEMKNTDITKISVSDLPDIKEFETDSSKSVKDRLIDYLHFVKNPYVFRVGNFGVKIEFVGDTPFEEALIRCINDQIQ